jgi:hypothetical protein
MTKRFLFTLVVLAALAFVLPTVALANYAIHGNYVTDTDACAGCHRAHTSVSTIQWTDQLGTEHNALLTTSATSMQEFCYACHDATSQGANTNVEYGMYEARSYTTGTDPNVDGGALNGGGFEKFQNEAVTTKHDSDGDHAWGAYGGGIWGQGDLDATGNWGMQIDADGNPNNAGETIPITMDCATCHDPHGSANYRILKASVFGNTVGGYVGGGADPTPDGWVQSTEEGWPVGGFRLHQAYPNYKPNYTAAKYAKGYDMAAGTVNENKGMSGWCSGCHATYNNKASDYATGGGFSSTYNAGDGFGFTERHRHPVNVELAVFKGQESLVTTDTLPLAHDLTETGNTSNGMSDWIECLTCHRAHGTNATMSGWASAAGGEMAGQPFVANSGGEVSALLRMDNRGVCEACHNK